MIRCINNMPFDEVPIDRILFLNSQLNGSGPRYNNSIDRFNKGYSNHG